LAPLAGLVLAGSVVAQSPKPVRIIEWVNRDLTVTRSVDVRLVPEPDAEMAGKLRQGAVVRVLGVVAGEAFLQVRLPDGQTLGYIPRDVMTASVAAAPPSPARREPPPPAAAPAPKQPDDQRVSGRAVVLDTGSLVVENRPRALAGIQGLSGAHAKALQEYIAGAGGSMICETVDPGRYACRLPNGTDVAMAALVNGSALTVPGAPTVYEEQQQAARAVRRGVWQLPFNTAQPCPWRTSRPAIRADRAWDRQRSGGPAGGGRSTWRARSHGAAASRPHGGAAPPISRSR